MSNRRHGIRVNFLSEFFGRQQGSDCKNSHFLSSILSILGASVRFRFQFCKSANPHEIKENKETSFAVQTQRVQIARDVYLD